MDGSRLQNALRDIEAAKQRIGPDSDVDRAIALIQAEAIADLAAAVRDQSAFLKSCLKDFDEDGETLRSLRNRQSGSAT